MLRPLLLFFFLFASLSAENKAIPKDYLLPKNHPLYKTLDKLLFDASLFDSPNHFASVGFSVLPRVHRQLMVARHPLAPGFIFKKFQNGIKEADQLGNYLKRITGARQLAQFIQQKGFKHIIVPQKWLYPLPRKIGKNSYLLIAEEMSLCSDLSDPLGENVQRYVQIDFDTLHELCTVVFHFRGLDSVLHNMPFTKNNQIAFIDTEKWRIKREGYLRHVMPYLTQDRKDYALALFEALSLE